MVQEGYEMEDDEEQAQRKTQEKTKYEMTPKIFEWKTGES